MIGALISLLSLDMTRKLVAVGMVASTMSVVGATNTTPVVLTTSSPHGILRPSHAVVAGIGGNAGANGLWVCTPVGPVTLSLSTFTEQGATYPSVGTGTYTNGGTVKIAFPDGSILLGRRNIALQTAVATPRIVFVPLGSPAWGLDPYGGWIPPIPTLPRVRADETAEQQTMKQQRQLATERHRFEVHVTGCASPPDPDFGDFDATQLIYQSLYGSMFDLITPDRARVLSGEWASQTPQSTSLDSRGQKWVGVVEIWQPVVDNVLSFVPSGTVGTEIVNFLNGASGDQTVIVLP
jgi:hypothetical protein